MTNREWTERWYAESQYRGRYLYKIDEPGMHELARAELSEMLGKGNYREFQGQYLRENATVSRPSLIASRSLLTRSGDRP